VTRPLPQQSPEDEGDRAMTQEERSVWRMSRRDVLKAGGLVAVGSAGLAIAPRVLKGLVVPGDATAADPAPNLKLAGTDGWIHLPPDPPIGFFHPDNLAPGPDDGQPDGLTTYIFGFRNVTGLDDTQVTKQKNHAQHSAPLFWAKEGVEFRANVRNIGLALRPDLFDAHTLHWHGFKNVIAYFDGEPTGSVSIPPGQNFTYVYKSHDPGTYMWHCHVEDVEHVQMGMTGLVFVRPAQDGNTSLYPSGKYAYNCGDGSTGFDREYAMFLSEVWAEAHWADAHIQLPEWSDYRADFSMLNGRVYPDTLVPNAPTTATPGAPFIPFDHDADGDLIAPTGRPDLKYQPMSSLVTCKAGDRVLLRFANLGFKEAAMNLVGIRMRIVGRDATLLRGRDGANASYETNTITIGAGESFDAIFTAPAHSGGSGPDTYVLRNRASTRADGGTSEGQRTEIRVYPSGSGAPAAQAFPNDQGM